MTAQLHPVAAGERQLALDALRGLALMGVVLVNLQSGFRASLFTHMFVFHTHAGLLNHATDVLLAWLFEFKAFSLLSFLFGIGVGVQADRAGGDAIPLLVRRFTVLFLIGLTHTLLLWNGDILALYAVCGLMLLPLVALPGKWLAMAGIGLILAAPQISELFEMLPDEAVIRAHAAEATRIYATGTYAGILVLRCNEAVSFIAPLLVGSLPRTVGLMLLGLAAWRSGVVTRPSAHRRLLLAVFVLAGGLGGLGTTLKLWSKETGHPDLAPGWLLPHLAVLLALGYGAGLWLWWTAPRTRVVDRLVLALAATGRMTLTNYLAQSVIFCAMFYGYGGGLFGRMGPAAAALLGVAVFAGQTAVSVWWLERARFGPAEWLWRSLAYGRWLPITRSD
jgi:uncharacterized protein